MPRFPALSLTRSRRPASVVGLQIEPGAIAAVEARAERGLVVERAAAASLDAHVVRDGEVADVEALSAALRALFEAEGFDRRVRLGIANGQVVVRTMDLPPITDPKEIAAAVQFQAGAELPMRVEDAVIDFHALGLVETPDGARQRVIVAAARRDMVERMIAAARGAGLRTEGIDLQAFAMVRAVAPATEEPVLVLAVGGLTNLAIAHRGACVFCRVAGGGLEGAAQALAERTAVPLDEARQAVVAARLDDPVPAELATGPEDPAVAILRETVRRIAAEARASVDVHTVAQAGAPVREAVLTGPVLGIRGFAEALETELGLPIRLGPVDGAPDEGAGRFAVAAGLTVAEAPGA